MLHIGQVPSALAVCLPAQCEQASAPAAVLLSVRLDEPLIELSLSSISPSALQPTATNIKPLRITTNSLLMTLLWVRDVRQSVTRITNSTQVQIFESQGEGSMTNPVNRRAFLRSTASVAAGVALARTGTAAALAADSPATKPKLRKAVKIGMI